MLGSVLIAALELLMRAFLGIVLTVWLTSMVSQPAFAEKRVALVIGNSAYQNVARLGNPANDPPRPQDIRDAARAAGLF
jgi:hypothetical protein